MLYKQFSLEKQNVMGEKNPSHSLVLQKEHNKMFYCLLS